MGTTVTTCPILLLDFLCVANLLVFRILGTVDVGRVSIHRVSEVWDQGVIELNKDDFRPVAADVVRLVVTQDLLLVHPVRDPNLSVCCDNDVLFRSICSIRPLKSRV
jgi:hypothetical protein